MEQTGCKIICGAPTTLAVKGLIMVMINFLVGPEEPLLATVKRRKLAWFGHVACHDSLSKTILQGIFEGWQRRSQQRKCWMDNIKD